MSLNLESHFAGNVYIIRCKRAIVADGSLKSMAVSVAKWVPRIPRHCIKKLRRGALAGVEQSLIAPVVRLPASPGSSGDSDCLAESPTRDSHRSDNSQRQAAFVSSLHLIQSEATIQSSCPLSR